MRASCLHHRTGSKTEMKPCLTEQESCLLLPIDNREGKSISPMVSAPDRPILESSGLPSLPRAKNVYRHIDCAEVYQNGKVAVGSALKKHFDEGVEKHEDLFINSKLWNTNQAPEDVTPALECTLQDL